MTDKELIKQLNSLKGLKMNDDSKSSSKSVLMTQISNTLSKDKELKSFNSFSFYFKNILSISSKPAMIVVGVFVFLVSSLFLGSDLYMNSKPTDSLYVARLLNERARLGATFNQDQRDRLALEFAQRNAKDIASLLMDPEFNTEENSEKIARLSESFKSEIDKVKERVAKNEQVKKDDSKVEEISILNNEDEKEEGAEVVALNEVEENGDSVEEETIVSIASISVDEEPLILATEETSTTSLDLKDLEEKIENVKDDKKEERATLEKIAEIEKLFEAGLYAEVLLKLQEIR